MSMDFHVFDTYVKAKDGHTIHFDIVTDKSNIEKAISFAKEWLKSIGEKSAKVTTEECKFCHTQSVPEDMGIEIMTNGYFISKMEGCPE
jgi:heterodisulfide reductase subunit B